MIIRVAAEADDAHEDTGEGLPRQKQHNGLLERLDLHLQFWCMIVSVFQQIMRHELEIVVGSPKTRKLTFTSGLSRSLMISSCWTADAFSV